LIDTEQARNARPISRRGLDQLEWFPGATMSIFNERFNSLLPGSKAIQTDWKCLGKETHFFPTGGTLFSTLGSSLFKNHPSTPLENSAIFTSDDLKKIF
jgi:hypothetical protein